MRSLPEPGTPLSSGSRSCLKPEAADLWRLGSGRGHACGRVERASWSAVLMRSLCVIRAPWAETM
jgi:hypothetical protein